MSILPGPLVLASSSRDQRATPADMAKTQESQNEVSCLDLRRRQHGPANRNSGIRRLHGRLPDRHPALQTDNVFLLGEGLKPTSTAATIRVRNGKAETMDGPFAETKEQLGGFYLLDCANLDDAIKCAAMIPTAQYGCVEIRPVMEY